MSTKIYTGFKLNTDNINDVQILVREFRVWAEKESEKLLDAYCERVKPNGWTQWCERRENIKRTGLRDPFVDTQFQIVVFPNEDGMLGMVFTEQKKWVNKWMRFSCRRNKMSKTSEKLKVQPYGYWNNSDPLDGMTDEEWELRGKEWDAVLKCEIPAMDGFTIDVTSPNGPLPKAWRDEIEAERKQVAENLARKQARLAATAQ